MLASDVSDKRVWAFVEYLTSGSRGAISKWVQNIQVEAKDDFHDLLNHLEAAQRDLWIRPDYDTLTPPDVGEIRWKSGGKQHRVLGFFKVEEKQYVMLIGATHKGRIYTPADAIKTARERKQDVLNGWNKTQEYKWK